MSELKPCPFCNVNEWKYQSHFSGTTIYQCEKCGTIVEEWVINIRPIEDALHARIAELEAGQRWIPVSEPPKECEMRVFKDGNAWCFVLPDFQDLQVSSSVWMKEGVLDKIYNDLGLVEEREE